MNYKSLLKRIVQLISSPQKAWEVVANETDKGLVNTDFVFPMVIFCGIACFLGNMSFDYDALMLQKTIKVVCSKMVSLLGGYFLAAYAINTIAAAWLHTPNNINRCQQLVGYSMVVIFVLNIVGALVPSFRLIQMIVQFYTVRIIWCGVPRLIKLPDALVMSFTLLTSVIVLITPLLISLVFDYLMKSAS